MTKAEVLAIVTASSPSSVQDVEGPITYDSLEDADTRMDEIRGHLNQLVIDGDLQYIAPGSGEVEKWEVV